MSGKRTPKSGPMQSTSLIHLPWNALNKYKRYEQWLCEVVLTMQWFVVEKRGKK